jgi:hypothetical protein
MRLERNENAFLNVLWMSRAKTSRIRGTVAVGCVLAAACSLRSLALVTNATIEESPKLEYARGRGWGVAAMLRVHN